MNHPAVTIVEKGIIRSASDFIRLNIIDWKRFRPYWDSEQQVMDRLSTWFAGRFDYTIAKVNLMEYPEREDFPGWNHVGDHESMGKLFWNHFKYCFEGELRFHDSPDFSGVIRHKDRTPQEWQFYGDIGKVSPIGMMDTIQGLYEHTMWISVVDENTQIILERLVPKDPNMTFAFTGYDEEGYWIEELVPIDYFRRLQEQEQRKGMKQLPLF